MLVCSRRQSRFGAIKRIVAHKKPGIRSLNVRSICRCGKSVYHAEEKKAAGASWHKNCFTCFHCKKGLESNNICNARGEIWCRACYGGKFGPKGYGYGGGAGVLQTSVASASEKPRQNVQTGPVNESFLGVGQSRGFQKPVSSGVRFVSAPRRPKKSAPAPAPAYTSTPDVSAPTAGGGFCPECGTAQQLGARFCPECGTKMAVEAKTAPPVKKMWVKPGNAAPPTASFSRLSVRSVGEGRRKFGSKKKSRFGGGNACGRCGKAVYHAEKRLAAGTVWHAKCFTCRACRKGVTPETVKTHDREIYCRACHSKNFGPKGYGFGGGAGTLHYAS